MLPIVNLVMLVLKLPFYRLKWSFHCLTLPFGQLIFGKIIKIAATGGHPPPLSNPGKHPAYREDSD